MAIRGVRSNHARAAALWVLLAWGVATPLAAAAQLGSLIVNITSPGGGATVSGTIPVNASVTIVGSLTVNRVDFYADGALIGSDSAAPYSVSWNTTLVSNGSHTLTAVARDLLGVGWNSDPVTVTVFNDTTPPAVSVTAPASGALLRNVVTLTADASDNVGVAGVRFFLDGALIGSEDTIAPYSISWDTATAAGGPHALTARARDAAGNTTTSLPISVTVDNSPPSVSVTSPAAGASLRGTVTVSASAADDAAVAGVQFFLDGSPLGAEDTASPYDVSWDTTTAADASHTLTARARDGAGNTADSAAVSVTVDNSTPPQATRIEETNPVLEYVGGWTQNYTGAPGGWSGGSVAFSVASGARATFTFTGTGVNWIGYRASNTGIAVVYLDGAAVATVDTYAPAAAVQSVIYTSPTLAAGSHTLAVEVTRTRNAAATDFIVVVDAFDVIGAPPDTTAPSVAVTAPAGGATLSGITTVTASASDNAGVASVQFFLDGAPLGTADAASPYSVVWDTSASADGAHTLTATATDTAGNTAASAPVTVTVSNASPPPASSVTRFEETELTIRYVPGTTEPGRPGEWWQGSRSRNWSVGTAAFNRSLGAQAIFTFSGTAVSWIGFRGPWSGIARVHLDGAFVVELDLYSTIEQTQAVVFSAAGLSPGTHTLTIESTGRKNPSAEDYAVVIDALDVLGGAPLPVSGIRLGESSATLTGAWTASGSDPAWTEGTAIASAAAGSRASVTFTGTSVSWIGLRGPANGIARVYLDGAFQATVDTYSAGEVHGVLYRATALAPGTHRLEVEVTGLKNAAASGATIVVDAFDVQSRIEDTAGSITRTGSWIDQDTLRAWSGTSLQTGGGTALRSQTGSAQASMSFIGSSVSWIGFRGPWAGIANVFLDGAPAGTIDLYSAAEQVQVPVFSATGLAEGAHTVSVEVTGNRNPAASFGFVVVDAFDVGLPAGASVVTRIQETDAAIGYTAPADWHSSGASNLWSGENARQSATAGARATLTFSGTSVRWLGERGFSTGLARVYVDGVFVAVVDTRAPAQAEYQVALFTASGLAPGSHTLAIEVIGRLGEPAGAPVERVVVDAFEVY